MKELSYLNIFNYYSGPKDFEDNLTRAFLILLKNSPFVFRMVVDLIISEMRETGGFYWRTVYNDLQEVKFYSQCSGKIDEDACSLNVPILITEKKMDYIPKIEEIKTFKETRADGVICLKPNIAFTIEVKRYNDVDWEQVYGHLKLFGEQINKASAVNITWDEIVRTMLNSLVFYEKLYEREGCVSGFEKNMVIDFIDFLSIYHPQLMPYENLELCRGNKFAYKKFLIEFMNTLDLGEVTPEKQPYFQIQNPEIKKIIERFYISVDEEMENIVIECYPADTTSQAQEFYGEVKPGNFFSLKDGGWEAETRLHFCYMGSQLVFADPQVELKEYVCYWKQNSEKIKQYKEGNFNNLYEQLLNDRLITEKNLEELENSFNKTARDHINLAPGLKLTYRLPIVEAEKLEKENRLAEKIELKINEVFEVFIHRE